MKKWMLVGIGGAIFLTGLLGSVCTSAMSTGGSQMVKQSIMASSTGANSGSFKDIKTSHWAKAAIDAAVQKGYFKGYADGTFKPNATVTRAEFAALLARVSKAEPNGDSANQAFSDLAGHWSETEVNRAVALGYISPGDYPNGFKPATAVTRMEIAKWMTSGLATADPDYKQAIEDTKKTVLPLKEYFANSLSQQQTPYIAVAMGTEIMSGYPDGSFGLNKSLTRAEAATVLLNLDRAMGKKADSFLGLKELRQVGTEGTNLETLTPFTSHHTLEKVIGKPDTFSNNAGSIVLHHYIAVDTQDINHVKGTYGSAFVDPSDRENEDNRFYKPGLYSIFMQVTIIPKTKKFNVDYYFGGIRDGLVIGGKIHNNLPSKYGYLTMPNQDTEEFFAKHNKANGVTLWMVQYISKDDLSTMLTDDGSVAALGEKK